MYNTPMMDFSQQADLDDPDISELKSQLSKISGECLAYLKGAAEALLFVQENHGLPSEMDKFRLEKGGG